MRYGTTIEVPEKSADEESPYYRTPIWTNHDMDEVLELLNASRRSRDDLHQQIIEFAVDLAINPSCLASDVAEALLKEFHE
jgi:hypothetical protein